MKKEELIKTLREVKAELSALRISQIKGELKDTSSLGKKKKEIAVLLTKLNTMENDS